MKKKILIVDDEKTVIRHVSTLLASNGYDYAFIPDPNLLEGKLNQEKYDAILLDINMPGKDGLVLLKEIKTNPKHKNIPVVMMTGETEKTVIENCKIMGANGFINKPIQESILTSSLGQLIG